MTLDSLQTATLTSLAMLKVNDDAKERQDYVDYLKPFAVHVLVKNKSFPVSREQLQDLLLQEFGLKVPVRGCELILKRLTKSGNLERSYGMYSLKKDLPRSDINERRAGAIRRGNFVVTRLAEFSKAEYKIEYDKSQATNAFLSFVSLFAIECLSTYANGTVLPGIQDRNSKEIHLVATFIKTAESKDHALFEDIVRLVKGNMLANALLCEDLESQQQKFKDVTFYLDTPVILDILGLHGKQQLNAALELLLSVTKLSGVFATFEHIIDETEKVLTHCERNVANSQITNRVLNYIRGEGLQGSDIALIRNNLQKLMGECKVRIQRTPKYDIPYQIDESSFQTVLEASSKYTNPNARNTDINSVRSIYVLRANKRPRRIEEAKAVLVTSNWRFAKESYRFGQQFEESREVSPVVTEFSLGNIAWLKSPLDTENLPKLELMASCYAIMEPSRKFWGKFLIEAEKLRSAGKLSSDDHAFLRSDHRVSSELMDLTLGAEDDLTEGTISEIRDRVIESVTREKDAELRRKEKKLQAEQFKMQKIALQNQSAINRISAFCGYLGKTVATIFGLLVSALLVVGILLPFLPMESISKAISWVFFGGAALLALTTITNLVLGVTVRKVCSQLSEKSSVLLKRVLLSMLGLKPSENR